MLNTIKSSDGRIGKVLASTLAATAFVAVAFGSFGTAQASSYSYGSGSSGCGSGSGYTCGPGQVDFGAVGYGYDTVLLGAGQDLNGLGETDKLMDIDFRTDNWSAYGSTTKTRSVDGTNFAVDGNVTVTVKAWDYQGDSGKLYWDNKDGYGVLGGENDEINDRELITINFSTAVMLEGVFLSDLFKATDGGNGETAIIDMFIYDALDTVDQGEWVRKNYTSITNGSDTNGEYYAAFADIDADKKAVSITKLRFLATQECNDEYSIAGLRGWPEVSAIPLPAAFPLYGTGLAVMGFIGWRKRRKAAVA